MKKTPKILRIEEMLGADLGDFLRVEYESKTIKDIAEQLSVDEHTLSKWMKWVGISSRNQSETLLFLKPVVKPSLEKLAEDYKLQTSNQLAGRYGVSGKTVRNWLKNYGIPLRHKGPFLIRPPKEDLSVRYRNASLKNLGLEYNVSRRTIKKWLDYYEIPIKIKDKKNPDIKIKKKMPQRRQRVESDRERKINPRENGNSISVYDFFYKVRPIIEAYNSRFILDPQETLLELKVKAEETAGDNRRWYSIAYRHYTRLNRSL